MITIVLTNRNRNLKTIKNCFESLYRQSNQEFELFFVDYGSNENYIFNLKQLLQEYPKVNAVLCPVSGQLWNKCRAINIALKKCRSPYFFVGDIDMIFHPDFVKELYIIKNEEKVTYFQVGFLSKQEASLNKDFNNAIIAFKSKKEATGMSFYPTEILKKINGYNEFYHGWGAEDTDVHIRLRNLGITVDFYDKYIFIKHQWHPKTYRTRLSQEPFHFNLEKINHSYIKLSENTQQTLTNLKNQWGVLPDPNEYNILSGTPDFTIDLLPEIAAVNACLAQLKNFEKKLISVAVKDVENANKIKQLTKKALGKKHLQFLSMKNVNDLILNEIVVHYRNLPYHYSFNEAEKTIRLKIYFPV
ncbi:glycosyltransferase family 2 protein [Flavobacterium sp. LC2016-12]|uniref:glycosyltransferase family 2 protein n=1 Tax=Flavobacterium sp. LC2016-12 TaxID=2783794 RepID=UPI00188B65F1|nr:galactosyltransferase-related protein [Flavobacterium sp. LC2016-12]MBF4465651.1 glycosyltransferase [Flavobacterium sp. LC2016-12]